MAVSIFTRSILDACKDPDTKAVALGSDRRVARRITRLTGFRFRVLPERGGCRRPRLYELLTRLERPVRLSVQDQQLVAEALINPPEPTPALRRAFERRFDKEQ